MKYFLVLVLPLLLFAAKPELLLLKKYDESKDVAGWLMGEKLDGVRAYWNGEKLLSRGGKEFAAPKWFTKEFPPFAIDGELWSKRGDFEAISSITSQQAPHEGWRQLTYNIFEVPDQNGGLLQRLAVLKTYLQQFSHTPIKIIEQIPCKDKEHLKTFLAEIEKKGGEGIVVRDPKAPYIDKRTDKALKVKSFEDAECQVTGYTQGKGKYSKKVGALECRLEDGRLIRLGSGLSDTQREHPPKIGTLVTFKYNGTTRNGLPRFPVYLRVREGSR